MHPKRKRETGNGERRAAPYVPACQAGGAGESCAATWSASCAAQSRWREHAIRLQEQPHQVLRVPAHQRHAGLLRHHRDIEGELNPGENRTLTMSSGARPWRQGNGKDGAVRGSQRKRYVGEQEDQILAASRSRVRRRPVGAERAPAGERRASGTG
jgi:ABC-type uncharacterized transport system YnjBCD ATPase subunit